MAHRPNVYISKIVPCDGGKSPNAFVPHITVEIRVVAPPHTQQRDVGALLYEAYLDASEGVEKKWTW